MAGRRKWRATRSKFTSTSSARKLGRNVIETVRGLGYRMKVGTP